MGLFKYAIDFDPTEPTSTDRIGSYLLGAGGDVVTTTDLGGGKFGLDVAIVSIMLGADSGVFTEDSAFTDGDKGSSVLLVREDTLAVSTSADGDYGSFKGTNKGELYTHDSDVLAQLVGLTKVEDAAAGNAYNGFAVFAVRNDAGTSLVSADGDFSAFSLDAVGRLRGFSTLDTASLVADDAVSSENPLLTGAVAHTPVSALSAVSASLDKVHFATDLHRRQFVNDSSAVGWSVSAPAAVNNAASVQLDATPLSYRRKVIVQNWSNKSIAVGPADTVTLSTGIMIPKLTERDMWFTAALPVWAIGDAVADQDIRVMQEG